MSRGPPNLKGLVSLKVDNLSYRTQPEDLRRIFDKYGEVGDIYIPRNPHTYESRGFAFVRYYDERDADDAMDSLDGKMFDERELRIQHARYGRPDDARQRYKPSRGSRSRSRSRGRRSRSRSRSRRRRSRSKSRSKSRTRRSRSRSGSRSRKRDRSASRERSRSKSKERERKSRSRSRNSKSSSRERGGSRGGRAASRSRSRSRS